MYSAKYCMGNDLLQYIFRTTNSTKITGEIVVFWAIIISGCPLFAVTINPENVTVHVVFVSKATGWDFEGLCSGGKGQMLHLPISLWIMIDGVDNILSLCHMCYGCVSLLYFQRLIVFTMNILSFYIYIYIYNEHIITLKVLTLRRWKLYLPLCSALHIPRIVMLKKPVPFGWRITKMEKFGRFCFCVCPVISFFMSCPEIPCLKLKPCIWVLARS